jgi:glyoxylase-like metal-dependent hydrolase (beta-lactamase superfamily II)
MNDERLKFEKEVVGFLEVNCYMVPSGSGKLLYIIDPGASPESIAAKARSFEVDEYVILLTHAHIDHISAVPELMDILPVSKLLLHEDDSTLYESPANELPPVMPALKTRPTPSHDFDSTDFTLIHTPGHTRGSVCYHFKAINAVFTGDTLFRSSVGRTDLPGGDGEAIINSIRGRLFTLPDDTPVFPGHGPSTTIAYEKRNNPYVQA